MSHYCDTVDSTDLFRKKDNIEMIQKAKQKPKSLDVIHIYWHRVMKKRIQHQQFPPKQASILNWKVHLFPSLPCKRTIASLIFSLVLLILLPLNGLKNTPRQSSSYNRKIWRHWIDTDKDCQDTRQEVLIRDSLRPVRFKTAKSCRVLSGLWKCPFTGEQFTNPRQLDVDHVVPLKEAYLSGGRRWSQERKIIYANDLSHPHHLLAVKASANRSKGASDPVKWMPKQHPCKYIQIWINIKKNYDLAMDPKERAKIREILNNCQPKSKKSINP